MVRYTFYISIVLIISTIIYISLYSNLYEYLSITLQSRIVLNTQYQKIKQFNNVSFNSVNDSRDDTSIKSLIDLKIEDIKNEQLHNDSINSFNDSADDINLKSQVVLKKLDKNITQINNHSLNSFNDSIDDKMLESKHFKNNSLISFFNHSRDNIININNTYEIKTQIKYLWIACVGGQDENTNKIYLRYYQTALESVFIKAPSLQPVLVFSGNPLDIPNWLIELDKNCKIFLINHNLTFSSKIRKYRPNIQHHGAFLRLDIPNIIHKLNSSHHCSLLTIDHDYGLYTDTDVMFYKDIDWINFQFPKVISMSTELLKQNDRSNSGVLFFNISAITNELPNLLDFADKGNWTFDALDQGLITTFYVNMSEYLPYEYNWKPYWGYSNQLVILHFHGPKPGNYADCFASCKSEDDIRKKCDFKPYTSILYKMKQSYHVSVEQQCQYYRKYVSDFLNIHYNFSIRMKNEYNITIAQYNLIKFD